MALLDDRSLYGAPSPWAASWMGLLADRFRFGRLGACVWQSRRIRGWARGAEAVALARASHGLPDSAVIVEIGSFLGCSAVLLAGARKLRGNGHLWCVDPFLATGDAFSVEIYLQIADSLDVSLRDQFERHIARAKVSDWISVLQMTAVEAARDWRQPVDMLYLDGDHSREGCAQAYLAWAPFLTSGGVLAVNNSGEGAHQPGHDGSAVLVRERVCAPEYRNIRRVEDITFANRC